MKMHSKFLLAKVLADFQKGYESGLPNQVYLEHHIELLEKQAGFYETQSKNLDLPPRLRARNRDLMQNALGLIKGIEFGIAFMLQSDNDLDSLVSKTSHPEEEPSQNH